MKIVEVEGQYHVKQDVVLEEITKSFTKNLNPFLHTHPWFRTNLFDLFL